MAKFKVGDKVLVKSGDSKASRALDGKTCTVSTVLEHRDTNGYSLLEEKDFNTEGGVWESETSEIKAETKESTVNYLILQNSLVLNYSGKNLTIAKDDARYAQVLKCIREKRLDDIPAVVEVERSFAGTALELKDGILYEGEQPIPTELNARIMGYKEENLPYYSLLKFWENLKKNPSFNSRKMLFAFLQNNGHPLTEDGCFIAYRGVTEDFKDKHTRKWDNSPGSVCEMDRSQVDENPNNTCSSGLHVACFEYAKDFGAKLVEVKVNPADVVAVPTDYNGTKMRVCRFEVVQECENMRTEVLYGTPAKTEEESEEEEDYREDGQCKDCDSDNDSFANYCSNCGSDDLHSN